MEIKKKNNMNKAMKSQKFGKKQISDDYRDLKEVLKKQHYALIGEHSALQICRWAKKSLVSEGNCYKEKFYGIKSHLCVQCTPATNFCQNKCLHCWRAIELTLGKNMNCKLDEPKKIIDDLILAQRKMLSGFKGNKKINMDKFREAQEPMHFAISLSGEPTLYPKLGEFIEELRKRGKTSFLVTNGLLPEKIKELERKKQLPTQLYVSFNYPNDEIFRKITRNKEKNAWKKFNETLTLLKKLNKKTRTVLRMSLVLGLNMENEEEYAKLAMKASPDFIEVKGFVSVGFSRKRLGYERMPNHNQIKKFAKKLLSEIKKYDKNYKILDEKIESKIVLIGKNKEKMKIKEKN